MAESSRHRRTGVSPTRDEDFPGWYQEVVRAADLAEPAHVRGAMVIKPWGYGIWQRMQARLDEEIRRRGHENVYFPMLIPLSYFQREADHVAGFAKEMAVVTHHRLEERDGKLVPAGELAEPLVVRPTSETIIGQSMADWIQSYRDLPLLLNQWANVVRWELRPRIFLRTSEFLWQEGHTAHATEAEAIEETIGSHRMYQQFTEDFLAMPVIPGEKPPSERFPGALQSFSIEAMMQDGKALQAGTSHYLGQNFARAADISFLDSDGQRRHAYNTSWGMSTRLIGGLIMVHSDDDGAVLPPRAAPHQVVIVPILRGGDRDGAVLEYADQVARAAAGETGPDGGPVRAHTDRRPHRSAGKRWEWTRKGAPVVVEVGLRDLDGGQVTWRRREDPGTVQSSALDAFPAAVAAALAEQQDLLYARARQRLADGIRRDLTTFAAAQEYFRDAKNPGFVLARWCGAPDCEVALKPAGATIRNLPDESAGLTADGPCLICGQDAGLTALYGLSY